MEMICSEIQELARRNNSSLKRIADRFSLLAHKLYELDIPDFKSGTLGFVREYRRSNIGTWGPAFVVPDQDWGWERSRVIYSESWGESFYLHGDFNAIVCGATRTQIREAALQFPSFLQELREYLRAEAKDLAQALENLSTKS